VLSLEELEPVPEPLADGVLELLELGLLLEPAEPLLEPLPLVAPLPELDLSALLDELLDGLLEELGGVPAELEELEPDGLLGVLAAPDEELEPEGDGVVVAPEPELEEEPAGRSGPRSQPAIRAAPSARETATARFENFMWPPWLGYQEGRARSEPRSTV
jgi:hypothetical protein